MKILILACVVAIAAAEMDCSKPEVSEKVLKKMKRKAMNSFKMRFKCAKGNWINIAPPEGMMDKMMEDDFNPKDLCFNVQAHIAAAKHLSALMKDCEPMQKKIFMHAMMKKFYEFCVKGEHEQCFSDVMTKMAGCSMQQGICPHDFMKAVKSDDECSSKLAEMEQCFESGMAPRCDQVVVDFDEGMKEHLEDIDDEASRHDVMCEMMSDL